MASNAMRNPPFTAARMGVEIEQRFHQRGIIGDGINHFDSCAADLRGTAPVKIDIGRVDDHPAVNDARAPINRLRHLFGCGSAIGSIVFDSKITGRPARIMAGGKNQPRRWRLCLRMTLLAAGVDRMPALSHQYPAKAVGGGHADGLLHHAAIVEAPIAPITSRPPALPSTTSKTDWMKFSA